MVSKHRLTQEQRATLKHLKDMVRLRDRLRKMPNANVAVEHIEEFTQEIIEGCIAMRELDVVRLLIQELDKQAVKNGR